MSEWWTYRLEDFLLFSPRVYWRMFELHNEQLWPSQLLALLFGVAALAWVLRPSSWSGQAISLGLAAAWLIVAWSFLWNRFAMINWAAAYAAPAFALEAMLLVWIGAIQKRLHPAASMTAIGVAGFALLLYALAVHPLLAPLAGRPFRAAEVFGTAPDPTAMATLGLVLMAPRGWRTWLLLPIPLAWCIASWLTLRAMGAWESWMPLVAAVLGIAAAALCASQSASPRGADRSATSL